MAAPPSSSGGAEAAALLLARQELLEYGVLPINLLVPQLDAWASLQALHQRLAQSAGGDGECEGGVCGVCVGAIAARERVCRAMLVVQALGAVLRC